MTHKLLALALAASTVLPACADEDPLQPVDLPAAVVVPGNGTAQVTVMTRNIYLGFDIDKLLKGEMPITDALPALQGTDFVKRATGLVAEIAAAQPDVIGLQEVIDYRVEIPGDFMTDFATDAQGTLLPFLDVLQATLAGAGLHYEVAVNNATTDVEVPVPNGQSPNGYMDVRYTDHDVILVRSGVEYEQVAAEIYDAKLAFELGGMPGTRPLGFAAIKANVGGAEFLFVSSHLETQASPAIQEAQTKQLAAWTQKQKLPIILVGDYNSAANPGAPADRYTRTYHMLQSHGRFYDLWTIANPDDEGLSCCHAGDLLGNQAFDQRIDLIMMDQVASKLVTDVSAWLVGVNPIWDTQPRWASDHAGLVATFRMAY